MKTIKAFENFECVRCFSVIFNDFYMQTRAALRRISRGWLKDVGRPDRII